MGSSGKSFYLKFIFTWNHKNSNYKCFDESYNSANGAHKTIEKEIKIQKDIECSKIVYGQYFRACIEKHELSENEL